jgi:hypothetical protein
MSSAIDPMRSSWHCSSRSRTGTRLAKDDRVAERLQGSADL